MTKPTYLLTDMNLCPNYDEDKGESIEYKSEAAAIKAGKEWLMTMPDDEVWVWKLSHIISKPDVEPDVEKVG